MEILRWMPALAAGFALLCLAFSLRAGRRQLLLDNLPTSKTTGVFIGLVELKGTAETQTPATSFLAAIPCVLYRYSIRESSTRKETESYTDSDGKSQTRTVDKTEWETVAEGGFDTAPFLLKDDRGVIQILPEGARIEAETVFSRTCGRSDPLYYGKGPATQVPNSDHFREFTEEAIRLQAPVFVIGHARQRADVVAAEIAAEDRTPLFVISTRTEEKVRRRYRRQFWLIGLSGLVAIIAYVFFGVYKINLDERAGLSTLVNWGVAYLGAWLFGWIAMFYNSLVELRQRVRRGWANIDVELKRRADLVPNLVKLVTGQRDYERIVQTELAALRAQTGVTAPGMPGPDPAALASPLRAIAEAYPALKANEAFLRLQKQLVETEDRISLARNYFNDIGTFFNTRLAVFPDGLIARLGSMRPQPLMGAGEFERASPLEK